MADMTPIEQAAAVAERLDNGLPRNGYREANGYRIDESAASAMLEDAAATIRQLIAENVRLAGLVAEMEAEAERRMHGVHTRIHELMSERDQARSEVRQLRFPADYPECSGDPNSCPENEGYGCCGGKTATAATGRGG